VVLEPTILFHPKIAILLHNAVTHPITLIIAGWRYGGSCRWGCPVFNWRLVLPVTCSFLSTTETLPSHTASGGPSSLN